MVVRQPRTFTRPHGASKRLARERRYVVIEGRQLTAVAGRAHVAHDERLGQHNAGEASREVARVSWVLPNQELRKHFFSRELPFRRPTIRAHLLSHGMSPRSSPSDR